MDEIVARGKVVLEAESNLAAETKRAVAEWKAAVKRLEATEADLEINIKTNRADLKKAEKDLDKFLRDRKNALRRNDDVAAESAKKSIDKQRAQISRLEKAYSGFEAKRAKLAQDYVKAESARQKTINTARDKLTKAELARDKAEIKSNQDKLDAEEKAEKRATEIYLQELGRRTDRKKKLDKEAQKAAEKAAKDAADARIAEENRVAKEEENFRKLSQRAEADMQRRQDAEDKRLHDSRLRRIAEQERAEAALLAERERAYRQTASLEKRAIELADRKQKLERSRNRAFTPQSERIRIKYDIDAIDEAIAEIGAKLALADRTLPKIDPIADDRGDALLGRWARALSDTAVRIGPFTTSIAGATRALAILGPTITGVIGTMGALVGVLGSATVGFGGLATAGLGAFGAVLGSTGLLMPKLLNDFKALNTLQKAYHTQVLKTGENSEKAKEKLKEFQHALGEVPPTTLKTFEELEKLNKSFDNLSKRARPAFFDTLAEVIQTGRWAIRSFGDESIESFELVASGVTAMSRALRSAEAKTIFQDLFDFGQESLPAFGRGLGNLAASAGRVAAAFAKMLPSFGGGFEQWTQGIADYTRNGPKMLNLVDRTSASLRSLGHFAQSAWNFLSAFFDQGVKPGIGLMDDMALGLDRVARQIRSGTAMEDFFGDSVETTRKLWDALKPLVALFIEWSTIMRPITNIMLEFVSALADITAWAASLGGVKLALQVGFGIFIGRSLITKVHALTEGFKALAGAAKAAAGASAAASATSALGAGAGARAAVGQRGAVRQPGGGSMLPAAGTVAAGVAGGNAVSYIGKTAAVAGTAAQNMSKLGQAARVARVGLTGVGAVLGVANPAFGAAVLGVGALAGAYVLLKRDAGEAERAVHDASLRTKETIDSYNALATVTPDVATAHDYAVIAVRDAEKALKRAKKGTDEYRLAELNLRDAKRRSLQTYNDERTAYRENIRLANQRVEDAKRESKARRDLAQQGVDDIKQQMNALSDQANYKQSAAYKDLLDDLARAEEKLADESRGVERALNAQKNAILNNSRARKGLLPLTGRDQQAMGALARRAPNVAQRVALKFEDPRRAGREAQRLLDRMDELNVNVRIEASASDFRRIEKNFRSLEDAADLSLNQIVKKSNRAFDSIKSGMGTKSRQGKELAARNFKLTADAIVASMTKSDRNVDRKMASIRTTFKEQTTRVKDNARVNFSAAAQAIIKAVDKGVIGSKRGAEEIRKLWAAQLEVYGFTPNQAKIAMRGRGADGQLNIPQDEGRQFARGGLTNVGRKGTRARDTVPAVLNGENAVIAKGEQVAVFNRHQQRAMDGMLPGGLEGFFASNRKPHYMARGGVVKGYQGGGIVPVPGFPGEMANVSILDEIAAVTRRFPGLVLTDAFGPGHQSPGHTVTGTAADFAGPDNVMDAAVRALVGAGYLVGYDGRFGSQRWPGHGPTSVAGNNAHLHVEFGAGGGGGLGAMMEPIKRIMAESGLGVVTVASQAVLDSLRGAANDSMTALGESLMASVGGGMGAGAGAGAATRAQMVAWATSALNQTKSLGHGGATPGNIAKILELAMKESSWIVNSINNWDSNAAAGNPSGGLMHVTIDKVGGSKEALFDPIINMIASIRYQMQRYGQLITFSPYARGGIAGTRSTQSFQTIAPGGAGGKIQKPTMMMGEDGAKNPEFVISSNPTYRKSNIERLNHAARALGVPQARAGNTWNPNKIMQDPVPNQPKAVPKTKGKYKTDLKKGKNKKRKKAYKRGNQWTNYIEQLEDNKGVLEQVVDYRSGLIEEPEDYMVEIGRIKDPETGEDYGPQMGVNTEAINAYVSQIQFMLEAYRNLQAVVDALVKAVPKARVAFKNERSWRKRNKKNLNDAIDRDQRIVNGKGKGKGNSKAAKEARREANKRIRKNERRLQQENTQIDNINFDLGALDDNEAGYFFENKTIKDEIADYEDIVGSKRNPGGIAGDTAEDAAAENARTAAEGAASRSVESITQQNSMADAERANILREFGGNTGMNPQQYNGTLGRTGVGGAGLQANLGGLSSGGAAFAGAALMSGSAAAGAGASTFGGAATALAGGGGMIAGGNNVSIVNNNSFLEPAPDPHTYIQGLQFEANAVV
jgi:hypothetical protein